LISGTSFFSKQNTHTHTSHSNCTDVYPKLCPHAQYAVDGGMLSAVIKFFGFKGFARLSSCDSLWSVMKGWNGTFEVAPQNLFEFSAWFFTQFLHMW